MNNAYLTLHTNVTWYIKFYLSSWGTKGDNSVAKDLGVVKVSEKDKGVKTVEIELPADQYDINCQYDEALFALDEKQVKKEVRCCFFIR